jgi:hypothetical protein
LLAGCCPPAGCCRCGPASVAAGAGGLVTVICAALAAQISSANTLIDNVRQSELDFRSRIVIPSGTIDKSVDLVSWHGYLFGLNSAPVRAESVESRLRDGVIGPID